MPSTASADIVAGAGVLDFGFFSGGAHVNVHAGVTIGDSAPLGVLAYSFPTYPGSASGLAGVAQLTCLRVEGNKASMKFRTLIGESFATQVIWIEDRGLLGLFGMRDRAAGNTIFRGRIPGSRDMSLRDRTRRLPRRRDRRLHGPRRALTGAATNPDEQWS